MGAIVDRYHVTTCSMLSTLGSTIGVFIIWGFSTSLPPLFVFAVESPAAGWQLGQALFGLSRRRTCRQIEGLYWPG